MKDFTPLQAARWVEQEAAKATTRAEIEARLASEAKFAPFIDKSGLSNSTAAHHALVAKLTARLSTLS